MPQYYCQLLLGETFIPEQSKVRAQPLLREEDGLRTFIVHDDNPSRDKLDGGRILY